MASDGENQDGIASSKTWKWVKAFGALVLHGPATLSALEKKISANKKEIYKIKEQVAKNSGTMQAILSLMPNLKIDQGSSN